MRTRIGNVVTVMAMLMGVALLAAPSAAEASDNPCPTGTCSLGTNVRSDQRPGTCLVVRGSVPNAPVVSYNCTDFFEDSLWEVNSTGKTSGPFEGTFWLKNSNSKQCLVVRGDANNAPAVQFPCGNFEDQFWSIVFQDPRSPRSSPFALVNAESGKCLTLRDRGFGTQAVQFECLGNSDQLFRVMTKPRRGPRPF